MQAGLLSGQILHGSQWRMRRTDARSLRAASRVSSRQELSNWRIGFPALTAFTAGPTPRPVPEREPVVLTGHGNVKERKSDDPQAGIPNRGDGRGAGAERSRGHCRFG